MAASEQQQQSILQLYDSFWFQHQIFKSNPSKTTQKTSLSIPLKNEKNFKLSRPPSLIVRSFSEEHLSSKYELLFDLEKTEAPSPKSVLVVPKLQPILSGKQVQEFVDNITEPNKKTEETEDTRRKYKGRRKKGNNNSKSLSELEFEELKGFMDLGFVFDNNEVNNSSLVSILPGLQRYCADNNNNNNEGKMVICENENAVLRPYLSEAWEVMDEEKERRKEVDNKKDNLVNWRIPNYGNDMEMKDHLRIWAHTVASTVR